MPADAAFCSSCGSPANADAETSQPGTTSGVSLPGIAFNIAGLLCYILWPVACILFLLVGPYNKNKFVRFHAYQAVFLGIAGIVAAIALQILTSILVLIPLLGWIVGSLVWIAYGITLLVLVILLMVKAYNGERYNVPVIGDLATQQADKIH